MEAVGLILGSGCLGAVIAMLVMSFFHNKAQEELIEEYEEAIVVRDLRIKQLEKRNPFEGVTGWFEGVRRSDRISDLDWTENNGTLNPVARR